MKDPRPIGGDFQLYEPQFSAVPGCQEDEYFQSGRDALRSIFRIEKDHGARNLWLPEYLCKSIVDAALREGFVPRYYSLTEKFIIDNKAVEEIAMTESSLVLLIDYFGLLDLSACVRSLKSNSAVVIVDKIQALFEQDDFGADYCFSGFRKFLAVPEGAFVSTIRHQVAPPEEKGLAGLIKTLGGLIKGYSEKTEVSESLYLNILRLGEEYLESASEPKSISDVGRILLAGADFGLVKSRRISNVDYFLQGMESIGLTTLIPILPDSVPLAIPLAIENRNEIRKALMGEKIYLPIHWPDSTDKPFSSYLIDHELSIVIDQRYDQCDMQRILDALGRLHVRNSKYVA
jgi:hypothetical protein